MERLHNVTFDEIKIGDSASIRHRLARTEVETLAVMAGDVDAFEIGDGEVVDREKICTEAVGAEALLSGLLNRKLPGPGTSISDQNLHFEGSLQAGDELVATVTAREKKAPGYVVFDCRITNDGEDLVSGTVTVRAPDHHITYSDLANPQVILRRTDKFAELLKRCEKLAPVTCVIAHPCDRDSLLGPLEAAKLGLIEPILVGPEAKIKAIADSEKISLSGYRIVSTEHARASAEKAVALVRAGEGESLMKGSLHTDVLMGAVVSSSAGLRTSRRISHAFLMDVPSHPHPLAITDAAINISPSLEDKMHIAQNVIDLCHVMGLEKPKVAILSAIETINSKIPSTLDAAALCKMADRGQIRGGVLDGPLAFDNAISELAAKTKKIESPVAGRADVMLVPDLESGNMLAKQLQYLAGAEAAGIVLGARVPIVLTSRADMVRTRLASIAVMKLIAHYRRTTPKAGSL